jgi:hypothetical protein
MHSLAVLQTETSSQLCSLCMAAYTMLTCSVATATTAAVELNSTEPYDSAEALQAASLFGSAVTYTGMTMKL